MAAKVKCWVRKRGHKWLRVNMVRIEFAPLVTVPVLKKSNLRTPKARLPKLRLVDPSRFSLTLCDLRSIGVMIGFEGQGDMKIELPSTVSNSRPTVLKFGFYVDQVWIGPKATMGFGLVPIADLSNKLP